MDTAYSLISDEFKDDLSQISSLVAAFDNAESGEPKLRIAAVNSATLLLAATFEEYIRQMAREYAKAVVIGAGSLERVPSKLVTTAWRRTFEVIAKSKFEDPIHNIGNRSKLHDARIEAEQLLDFAVGDVTKDIYKHLVHNEVNMRPAEINRLFKLSGLQNVCLSVCETATLQGHFSDSDQGRTHGLLLRGLEDFFERRNEVAHALNPARSESPSTLQNDIRMFVAFADALCATLAP